MKKILAAILAIMMLGVVMFTALAENETDQIENGEPAGEIIDTVDEVPAEAPAEEEPAAEAAPVEEPAEEPAQEEAPAQVEEAPAEIVETPAPAEEAPVQAEEIPAQAEEIPAQVEEAPVQAEEIPAQAEEVPAQVEEVPAPAEEAPAQVEEAPAAAEPVAFTGTLAAKLENEGDITEGQEIVLKADVQNANMNYSFQWQRTPKERKEDEEEIWTAVSNVLRYTFEATEKADDYFYRATLTAEDGTTLCSGRISFKVLPAEEDELEDDLSEDELEDELEDEELDDFEDYDTALGLDTIVTLYTQEAADVRLDADGLSAIFATLEKGTAVTTVGQVGSWTRVVIGDQVGFIYSDSLADTLPAEEPAEEDAEETAEEPAEEPAEESAKEPAEGIALIAAEEQPKEKKVVIFSSRRTVMEEGEDVFLTSIIEGFEGLEVIYQWECDQGDGFRNVENANENTYVFKASTESLSWKWRLTVYYR